MARHANDGPHRRGVAPWVLITSAVVAVVVVATAVFLWAVNKPSTVTSCTSNAVLQVMASAETAPAVTAAAAAFDASKPIARSACITTQVGSDDGADVVAGLAGGWKGRTTPAPGMWVASSVADVTALDTKAPSVIAGRSTTPIGTTPTVLAVPAADAGALTGLSWSALAEGAGKPAGIALANGRTFTLGWPDPAGNAPSTAALQSIAVADDPQVSQADQGTVTTSTALMAGLRESSFSGLPNTTQAALTALAAGSNGFTAMPATEAQVAGVSGLAAVYPTGRTVSFGVLPVVLTADWVDPTASAAAASFRTFLSGPAGRQILADHGFRVPGVSPSVSMSGVHAGTAVVALPDASPEVRAALAAEFATGSAADSSSSSPPTTASSTRPSASASPHPTPGPTPSHRPTPSASATPAASPSPSVSPTPAAGAVVTFVIDTSAAMATVDGTGTRLAAVQNAVTTALAANSGAQAGLWTVSTADGSTGFTQRIVTGPVSEQSRATALPGALSAITPSGSCWLYGAIQTVYPDAAGKVVAGRPNRVVVITASSDSTPGLSRSTLVTGITGVANSGVELDVLGLSDDVNTTAMTQIAQAGHGTYTRVAVADLNAKLTALLKA